MSTLKKNILYLLNPRSNEDYGLKLWQKVCKKYNFLPKDPFDLTTVDIASLIAQQKPDIIVIAGGDGSVNTVCKAIALYKNKPLLAILPFGYGNVLAYCFGVETIEKSIAALQKQTHTMTIDAMKTNIPSSPLGLFNI